MLRNNLHYALLAVVRRWRRNLLTVLAMLAGTTTIIMLVGVSESSALNTSSQLASYDSTRLGVRLQPQTWDIPEEELLWRVNQIPEVKAAGTVTIDTQATRPQVNRPGHEGQQTLLAVVSEAGLKARGAHIVEGHFSEPARERRGEPTVYLGVALAKELGVSTEPGRNMIEVNGMRAYVLGIIRDGGKNAALSSALILPTTSTFLPQAHTLQRGMDVIVNPGSADTVAEQLKQVLDPQRAPVDTNIEIPPSPVTLRASLTKDSRTLTTIILVVLIVSTSFGIVMTMQISVWERRREIGINRALGLGRRDVAVSFLAEAALLGALGALGGFILGILGSWVVCLLNGWVLSLPPLILGIPFLGLAVGIVVGALPAYAATKVQPLELLQ